MLSFTQKREADSDHDADCVYRITTDWNNPSIIYGCNHQPGTTHISSFQVKGHCSVKWTPWPFDWKVISSSAWSMNVFCTRGRYSLIPHTPSSWRRPFFVFFARNSQCLHVHKKWFGWTTASHWVNRTKFFCCAPMTFCCEILLLENKENKDPKESKKDNFSIKNFFFSGFKTFRCKILLLESNDDKDFIERKNKLRLLSRIPWTQ